MKPRWSVGCKPVLVVAIMAVAHAAAAAGPQGVVPGGVDRVEVVEGRCPTFIWQAAAGADYHELVVYETVDPDDSVLDLEMANEVLYARVPGAVPAWTPELARCLVPGGRYAWFVRAVYDDETGDASEWSEPRLFAVAPAPSLAEVSAALDVLRRYTAASGGDAVTAGGSVSRHEAATRDAARIAAPAVSPKSSSRSVPTGVAAIRGEQADAAGQTYGVVGVSGSPGGAGVGAANTAGGADLVLDGSAHGVADTVLTESGIDRPSPLPQTFTVANSDGGGMTIEVAGSIAGDGSLLTGVTATDVHCEGCVAAHDLALGAVGTDQLADAAVTASRIAKGAVTNDAIAEAAVGPAEIASWAVATDELQDGAVTGPKLATDAVTADAIAANAVGASEIATDAVGASEISGSAVGAGEIASGAVGSSEIADSAVRLRHLSTLTAEVVECNGECTDGNLWDICGTGRQPYAVTCRDIDEQNWGVSCGGDNECSGYWFGGQFSLGSFCEDVSGWDAIVFCLAD